MARNFFLLLLLFFSACRSTTPLFRSSTPHERYAEKLANAGLHTSAAGNQWLAAASRALSQPVQANLPFSETGYFDAARPGALGYRFSARRGDKLNIQVAKKPITGFALFMELWQPGQPNPLKLLASADTSLRLQWEVEANTDFVLRLQPELLASGEFSLSISTEPSLAFPVPARDKPRIISLWGVDRDGGARRHEGIDIAAAKRTPLVASADGTIVSTRENNLGGKVVFLRPEGRNYQLYYAHLDEHRVQTGERVRAGDTVGLMGNSGNAKTTVPHLHFGIYTADGPVDPLPFVQLDRPAPPRLQATLPAGAGWLRVAAATNLLSSAGRNAAALRALPAGTALWAQAGQGGYYRVMLPQTGAEGYVALGAAKPAATLTSARLQANALLLNAPTADAPAKRRLPAGTPVQVLGKWEGFDLVEVDGIEGWVAR